MRSAVVTELLAFFGLDERLAHLIDAFSRQFQPREFWGLSANINALLALILVGLSCGMVGSLVVGARMAFFSDALAHCAFASVSVGFLIFDIFLRATRPAEEFWLWVTPIMVAFGVVVACGIAYVRQNTRLTSDTVIGVFFAGAIGLAALLRKLFNSRALFNLEEFLFGDPLLATAGDLIVLCILLLITTVVLWRIYNPLLLTGFNSSLALSRRVPVHTIHYLFVILLAVIVNVCLRAVGALLINALIVVPAAIAINLSRNLRQLFWFTILLSVSISVGGHVLSWELNCRATKRHDPQFAISGTIILLGVFLFILSLLVGPYLRRRGRSRVETPA
jgi:zinc transport system permease protein